MGNIVLGSDGISVRQGIYEESLAPKAELGRFLEFEDGRKFRYCRNGDTALVAGVLVQAPAGLTGDDAIVLAAAGDLGQNKLTITVNTSGDYDAHALQGGYLVVSKGATPDIGTFYKIKDNAAMVAAASAVITLYDNLATALTIAANQVGVSPNPFNGVVKDADSAPLIGVPLIKVTIAYYFWCLVAGYGPATDSTSSISKGDFVTNVSGDVATFAGTETTPVVGQAVMDAAANEALIVRYFIGL